MKSLILKIENKSRPCAGFPYFIWFVRFKSGPYKGANMEEREIPPDEKDWIEMVGLQEDEFLENILFHRMKIYVHKKIPSEALLTIEFLSLGVVLKCRGIKSGESHDKYFYLQLSDNSWVKGLANRRFSLDTDLEIRDGFNIYV